jgi:DNA replication protein DnaC
VQNPFDSIESAHQVEGSVQQDLISLVGNERRSEALHLVNYKLDQLKSHLTTSARLLNDLRVLRRLLLGERQSRESVVAVGAARSEK